MTFTSGIPAANNNPSNDQPLMLGNFTAINNWTVVDHVGFNSVGHSGKHIQVTFDTNTSYIAPPAMPAGNNSILYTQAGLASSNAQLFFQNSNIPVMASAIRAWAYSTAATNSPFTGQGYNVSSITRNSAGNYTVVLATNAVTANPYAVLVSYQFSAAILTPNYIITGTVGTFNLLFSLTTIATADPVSFSFIVLQY